MILDEKWGDSGEVGKPFGAVRTRYPFKRPKNRMTPESRKSTGTQNQGFLR